MADSGITPLNRLLFEARKCIGLMYHNDDRWFGSYDAETKQSLINLERALVAYEKSLRVVKNYDV